MALKYGPAATLEQIAEAIESLSDADFLRLRKAGSAMLWGTGLAHPDDLVNETLERVLALSRKWPTDVPFTTFLVNAMRSVADGIRNLEHQTEEVLASDLVGNDPADDGEDPMEQFGTKRLAPETVILTEEVCQRAQADLAAIEKHFYNDNEVGWVLMGIEDRLSANEICEMSGMTRTQYETGRKRLRRGIERLFPGRRKP